MCKESVHTNSPRSDRSEFERKGNLATTAGPITVSPLER
ncbi:hypothetical protein RISK_004262 [Rhodopirellula islandica]|uniref:Uncharacterized protein n=1 Tax=Rhodopirellula islandica TaxID=595434 RepID=A0A0J1BAY8_RHOIS|nr:hypothetical protein RISK_004262 [Rhodopirellula islandica]